jgi:hypothetical protein
MDRGAGRIFAGRAWTTTHRGRQWAAACCLPNGSEMPADETAEQYV